MLLTNIEFFTFEREVWYRHQGSINKLHEHDYKIIAALLDHIAAFYPKAYEALHAEYKKSALNPSYFRFRMAARFIRCNLSKLDNIPDFSDSESCSFEYVTCPLRGECPHEGVICRPQFDHKLSTAELRVMHLWFYRDDIIEIASRLNLSQHTVNNHIRNAYQRLGIHSRADFIRIASKHNLFS